MEKVSDISEVTKKQYQSLSETFENWYFNKLKEIEAEKNLCRPPKNMLKRLAISEDEFYETYIKPYKSLSIRDLETVFKILAPELLEKYTGIAFYIEESMPFNGELRLKYDLSSARKENALSWLLFQVNLLEIFKFSKKLYKYLFEPYHQCYYCGRPNSYIKNSKIKKFNLRDVYCHKDKCQKSPNPERHDNCCFSKWVRRRKSLEKALKNAEKLSNDIIENYEDFDASDKQKEIFNDKLNSIFISFCEKQYQENLKINYTIQSKGVKAINLKRHNL